MSMRHRNLAAGVVLLAVGIGYGLATGLLPDRTLPGTPGPAFFPGLIAIGLIGLSATLTAQSLYGSRLAKRFHGRRRQGDSSDYRLPGRGWFALGGFAAYLLLLPFAGFVLASVPFCGGLAVLYGERRPIVALAAAVSIPLMLFMLFGTGFQVLLPRGAWW